MFLELINSTNTCWAPTNNALNAVGTEKQTQCLSQKIKKKFFFKDPVPTGKDLIS